MKSHPYADLFPMMTATELESLTESIKANGLRYPIVRYQGMILDGRNRLEACKRAGIEPTFIVHEGDDTSALALVFDMNAERRELTAAQRAIVAARALEQLPERRGGDRAKSKVNGQCILSRESVAKTFKVGVNAVQQAKALLTEANDLALQVLSCALSLAAGYEQLQQRRAQEAQRNKDATQKAKDAEKAAEFKEAVSNGEMTLDEALQKAMQDEREERQRIAAETDARSHTLKEFVEKIDWFERFFKDRTDEDLAWWTIPNSPGLINHGITSERVHNVIAGLQRAAVHTFGDRK